MTRVLTVDLQCEAVAYPYEVLAQARVVNDGVGEPSPGGAVDGGDRLGPRL